MLVSARSNAIKFPSIAEDTVTDLWNSKLVLQKLLKSINGMQGYSVEQCAAEFLDYPSFYTTEASS